jgi:8-oxo-dGTP pyrophosphatase MutT (NUDIX family)
MSQWRPPQQVKVKVVGLARRGEQLLLAEVEDDSGRLKGLRPLGGSIEFGVTREAALQREFREELGCGVTLLGPWHGFENIYEHEGARGHEYIFAAPVRLEDDRLYLQDTIHFHEANLIACRAGWYALDRLPPGAELYPTGLPDFLWAKLSPRKV